jgi:hypothetical protein
MKMSVVAGVLHPDTLQELSSHQKDRMEDVLAVKSQLGFFFR